MGDEGSGRSTILSTITMILSTRLLIHSTTSMLHYGGI